MLKQRVITALVLMAVLLPTLAADALWPFALLSLLFIAAAAWEWGRLNQAPGWRAVVLALLVAAAGLAVARATGLPVWQGGAGPEVASAAAQPHEHVPGHAPVGFLLPGSLWWAALALWVVGGGLALRFGTARWKHLPVAPRALLGLLVLTLAWLALTEAKLQGLNFLLSVMALVWVADIGAYFGGRRFGRRKLAPSISPGKSWEGVVAGMLAALLLAAAWIALDRQWHVDSPSLYSRLLMGLGPAGLVAAVLGLTAMSVVGDLFESLVKRQAGAKDSSQLLPGHGGVLDRIDALLPVLPLSLAVVSLCHG